MTALSLIFAALSVLYGCGWKSSAHESSVKDPIEVKHRYEALRPLVILKLDDLWFERGSVHPGWQKTIDFLNQNNITGTIGLVGESLENPNEEYLGWIRARHLEGHEIWNHGYCHCRDTQVGTDGILTSEFQFRPLAQQLESLEKTQTLAREKLGIDLVSFGAPYNATDESTATALAQLTSIKIWLFKDSDAASEKLLLPRTGALNIEYPVHVPDAEQFKQAFTDNRDVRPMVIQGHPRSWLQAPERWDNFVEIIQFLQAQNAMFITPSRYAKDYAY